MTRRFPRYALVAALLSVLFLVPAVGANAATAAPHAAQSRTPAPAAALVTDPLTGIHLTGRVRGGGSFDGTLDVQDFTTQQNHLMADGVLTGSMTDAHGHTTTITDQAVLVPVKVRATCNAITLDLGPTQATMQGSTVDLAAVRRAITDRSAPGALLCATGGLVATNPPPSAVAAVLNSVLRAAATSAVVAGSLSTIPVTGTVNGGGSFEGLFTIQRFVMQHQSLAATGVLYGTIIDASSHMTTISNQSATLPVAIAGTCQSLKLSFAAQRLTLDNQRVDLSSTSFRIAAPQGQGKALCAAAQAAKANASTSAAATALNNLLHAQTAAQGAQSLRAFPVNGATSKGGSFEGMFEAQRIAPGHGGLTVTGALTGTLTEVSGAAMPVLARSVAMPLSIHGSCDVLTLGLGPAKVDTQGRSIDLSATQRSLTTRNAPRGLLCAAAQLTRVHAPANALAHVLNQVLSALTG